MDGDASRLPVRSDQRALIAIQPVAAADRAEILAVGELKIINIEMLKNRKYDHVCALTPPM